MVLRCLQRILFLESARTWQKRNPHPIQAAEDAPYGANRRDMRPFLEHMSQAIKGNAYAGMHTPRMNGKRQKQSHSSRFDRVGGI